MAKDSWKTGTGFLGVIASGGAGTTWTLGPGQAKYFSVGMTLEAATTETGAVKAGTAFVTNIDFDTETIEVTLNGLTGADGDYLWQQGDAPNGGAIKKITGVRAWIPAPGDTVGSLFGVDRTIHEQRLAGHRLDGTGLSGKEEAIKRLIAKIRDQGGNRARPNMVWMNPLDLDDLTTELGSKREYHRVDVKDADVGYDGVTFRGPGGSITAIDDMWVPEGLAWVLDQRTWEFSSLGPAPKMITHDGQRVLRLSDSDGIELRAVYRGQLICNAPGWNGCVALPT